MKVSALGLCGCDAMPAVEYQRIYRAAVDAANRAAIVEEESIRLEKMDAAKDRAARDAHSPPEAEAAETESLAHRIERIELVTQNRFNEAEQRAMRIERRVENLTRIVGNTDREEGIRKRLHDVETQLAALRKALRTIGQ